MSTRYYHEDSKSLDTLWELREIDAWADGDGGWTWNDSFVPNFIGASRYCLRGISVCEEWNDFAVFRDWAIANGYEDNLTIDRIDNDRGYCPSNCRWITLRDQQSNRSTNIKIQYAGHEFPTLKKAAEFFGIPYKIAQHRWYVHRDLDIVFRKETK